MEADLNVAAPAWLAGLVIVSLLAASAFFAMAETALVSSSRARLQALARKGNLRAARVRRLREKQGTVLSAVLLGNILVNVIVSAFATGFFVDLFGERGVVYAAAVMTVLVVVFAEVLPKTYALNRADRVVLALAPALEFAVRVLGPVNRAVGWIVDALLRVVGGHRPLRSAEAAIEELRG